MKYPPRASAHSFVATKPPEFDRDRTIALTPEVAAVFISETNKKLSALSSLLSPEKMVTFAQIIARDPHFPFTATASQEALVLAPALNKSTAPVLKDISDGVTEISKQLAAAMPLGEHAKFAIAELFQPAIYRAYHAAGMEEGAHTKYTARGC